MCESMERLNCAWVRTAFRRWLGRGFCSGNRDVFMVRGKVFCSRCGRELINGYHLLVTGDGTKKPVCKDDRLCIKTVYLPKKVKK